MRELLVTVLSASLIVPPSLPDLVKKSYLELLDLSPAVRLDAAEAERYRQQLEQEKKNERRRLEEEEKQLKRKIEAARHELDKLNRSGSADTPENAATRRKLHCDVIKLERDARDKRTERDHGIPVAFDNKLAKLELLEHWPSKKAEIERVIASGEARQRPHGNVEDIGFRKIQDGQEKDVKLGEEAIRELRAYGMMPRASEDKELNEWVTKLAHDIAIHSDLKVPLKVTILDSEEINAFALPGGFLYINTGLIEKAESEAELAGVIAHELSHVTARHGARLMRKATIATIVYQAAQVAAVIFTGGAVGIGAYYALQYGFYGLGMVLSLTLLGVSREYEAEADQLGVQYAWKAGYDPAGFITFFDKMSSEKGYVKSASFFRTHPPFYDRIVSTFSEMEYLPKSNGLRLDSTNFHQMQDAWKARRKHRPVGKKPTLISAPECDDEAKPEGGSKHAERRMVHVCETVSF